MSRDFKTQLATDFHVHFGFIKDQNGKQIHPDEIVDWFNRHFRREVMKPDPSKCTHDFSNGDHVLNTCKRCGQSILE